MPFTISDQKTERFVFLWSCTAVDHRDQV